MLDLEDQLRRYGEALEHDLLEDSDSKLRSTAVTPRPWRRILAVAAVIAVLAGGAVVVLVDTTEDQDSVVTADTAKPTEVRHAGVFTTPTDTVLLFSDGIDGATAVDLDRRLAGRRVVDGERAGDQQFRLTLTGDHLVVGWGEIYAAPLDGGPSKEIADATIYLPASEDGEVWTLAWEGGRIGAGPATLRRVEIDGTTVFESTSFDPAILEPVQGVPGGLLVNSPEGVAVWDAETETTGPVLGPGRAVAATTDGQIVAWCADSCAEISTASLERKGAPTAAHASGAQQIVLSPDGSLAVLRPDGELTLTSSSTATEGEVVARGLDAFGALVWSQDGEQLFYTENSYGDSSMRVGRYELESRQWEIETLPIGDGLAAIAVTRDAARSFFAENLVSERECPGAGGTYPSGRDGVCTFAFFTPDSPAECVADGPSTVEVPEALGLPLEEAAIRMQLAGLTVVGSGTAGADDSSEPDAVVQAQEPPAGVSVPAGACVGFRTEPR